jgi:RNA polymerase sigma-70 factor (ECF subfamily)
MQNEDKEIIEKYLAGEEEAFSLLLQKYLKSVFNFIFQFTRDATISEDLAQVTFIKAWKNLEKFDCKKNFKTWLFAIAKNNTYDYFRKKKTLPFSSFEDEDGNNKLENISSQDILPNEILERVDIVREMEDKLREIPEKYRVILTLHYKEDFSLTEIAEILGSPYNTIKAYHKRALLSLKKAFLREK